MSLIITEMQMSNFALFQDSRITFPRDYSPLNKSVSI